MSDRIKIVIMNIIMFIVWILLTTITAGDPL